VAFVSSVFFLSPLGVLLVFLSRFWAFRNKGSSKTRAKESRKFIRSPQPPKKAATYGAPCFPVPLPRGQWMSLQGPEKKMTKVTYICCSSKKK
jgi:hypothetical protein